MEKHRKILVILIVISLVFVGLAVILGLSEEIGLCAKNEASCLNFYSESIAQPLFFGFISLMVVSVLLLFFSQEVFNLWWKWAIILFPLLTFLVLITPVQCRAPLGMCFDKELTTLWSSGLFLTISLVVIIYKSIQLHHKKNSTLK